MQIAEYIEMFQDGIVNALLDWDTVRRLDCVVTERFSRSSEHLGDAFTVWYETAGGLNGDWRNKGDHPLRVRDAVRTYADWPAERKDRVNEFKGIFKGGEDPVLLVLPAYSLPSSAQLILDGTHRAVAAFSAKVDVRLMMFSIQGPCDPAILPDLGHHSPAS
jgi:hypothetical protein